jgi:hypothetical protein
MTEIPKHERKKRRTKPPQPQPATQTPQLVITGPVPPSGIYPSTPSIQHEINHVAGLAGIEQSLDCLVSAVARLTSDEHNIGLCTSEGTYPVKITLGENIHDDTLDRLITAFERIADSVAKLAGFTRPRLESWHEQEEYTPRFKDVACDGGAPGPKTS